MNMNFVLEPWQLILLILAGWMNREQQQRIDYLETQFAVDRDATFSQAFRDFLRNEGVKPVRLPPRSPNFNAHLERFFGSLKSECLHKLILFGENATRNAVRAYLVHYHTERNHQGIDNELIVPLSRPPDMDAEIETTERLGGLLRSYKRAA
jgi:putative transposase